jgi:rhodanese-related sulfurtransferase
LSASAVRQLAAQGFTKAFNLRGGLAAWRTENLPLTRGEKA